MGYPLTQNQTAQPLVFFLTLSSDHISGATGLTPTVTISKNGAAFAAPAGAVTEIGNGFYKVAGNATDSNTLGPLCLHASATGADPCDDLFPVVAYNPQDAVHFGLSALPNTACTTNASLITSGTGTDQLQVTGGLASSNAKQINGVATTSVTTINANVGTTQPTNFTGTGASALVKSDAVDIGGVAAASGTIGTVTNTVSANVTEWNGAAVAGTLPPDQVFLRVGTAQAGGASTITLDSGASATNNFYQNAVVFLYGGTGAGQCALITTYAGATKVATINGTWATNPDATSKFALLPFGAISASVSGNVTVGGYAAGQDPGTYVLLTPANKLETDASGRVDVSKWLGNAVTVDASNLPNVNVKDYNGTVVSAQPFTGTPPTTAQIATAIFTDLTSSSDFSTANSIGALLKTNLDTNVSSRLASSSYTAPPSAASIATTIFTDLTSGTDFNTAGSFGALVKANLDTNVGSRMATFTLPTNFSSLAITVGGSVTVGTNNDKTGYSLTQAFPTNFAALGISATGHISNVDNLVANGDKTGYALSSSGVDAVVVETGLNLRQAVSLIAAASAGVLSGAATTTVTIEGAGVSTTRIVAQVDSSGDRTSLTLTPPP